MAERFGAGVAGKAGTNTADTVMFELRATAATVRLRVLQIVVAVQSAPSTAPVFYLTRASANGTSSTTLVGQPIDSADPTSLATFDSAWSAAPTITAANKIDVGPVPVTAGSTWVFSFWDEPLVLQASTTAGGLCIVNSPATGATTGTFAASARWIE